MLLKDKIALVTGAAGGAGKAICMKYAEEGCSLIVTDLHLEAAQKVAEEVKTKGGKAIALKADISRQDEVHAMVTQAIDQYGRIDILVNCAGGVPGIGPGDSDTITVEEWHRIININLNGTFYILYEVLPYMKKQNYGKIINFSSMGAFHPFGSVLHYHAAKGAIESLSANLAFELAPRNIYVNIIVPGPIKTPFWDELMPDGPEREAFFAALCKKEVPLGRMGTPEDLAGAALYLGSGLSDYVTGQTLFVAGGMPVLSHESTFLASASFRNQQ